MSSHQHQPSPADLYAAATGQTGEFVEPVVPSRPCQCGDYHSGDADHHGVADRCPRQAVRDGLCEQCWNAVPE